MAQGRGRPALKPHQVGQAGQHLVAAEIHLRAGYAVTFSGNMPAVDLLAADAGRTRTVHVQVKTRRAGSWHTNGGHARPRKRPRAAARQTRRFGSFSPS
jgi:hypothetical protein